MRKDAAPGQPRDADEAILLAALFDEAPVGLALVDSKLRYIRVNRFLAEMNGESPEAHLGRRPTEVLGAAGEPVEALLEQVLATAEPVRGLEVSTPTPKQGTLHLRASFFPVRSDQRILGICGVVADETKARKSALSLQRGNKQLMDLDAQRIQLMQIVAHEIKNPLSALTIQLQLMQRSASEEQRQKAFDVLKRNLERLQTLAQDLGDVARMQGKQLPLALQSVPMSRLLDEAIQRHTGTAEHAGIDLECEIHSDVEAKVDPSRLAQVLDNIIGNALKFTPHDGTVRVSLAAVDKKAVVAVRDTGPGLSPEQIGKLFQAFARVHPEARKKGTGLGLYISKLIMEQHGGTIWATSEGPGKGSTFAFSLPLD